jgi:hypothetical protein
MLYDGKSKKTPVKSFPFYGCGWFGGDVQGHWILVGALVAHWSPRTTSILLFIHHKDTGFLSI